jgi:hypothetical protein
MRKADAIEKIRHGSPLICEHDEEGAAKYFVAGGGYPAQGSAWPDCEARPGLPEGRSIRDLGASIMEASIMDCLMCAHCQRYRDRLWCGLFGCSTPFARDDEKQCGFLGKGFKAKSSV